MEKNNQLESKEFLKPKIVPVPVYSEVGESDLLAMLNSIFQRRLPYEWSFDDYHMAINRDISGLPLPNMPLLPRTTCLLPPIGGQQLSNLEIYEKIRKKIYEYPVGFETTATVIQVSQEDITFFVCNFNRISMPIEYLHVGKIALQELEQFPNYGEIFGFYDVIENAISRVTIASQSPDGGYEAYMIDFGEYIHMTGRERIFKLPIFLKNLPAEAIKCSLANILHVDMLRKLLRQDVKLQVLSNNGIHLIVDVTRENNDLETSEIPVRIYSNDDEELDDLDMEVARVLHGTLLQRPYVGSIVRLHVTYVSCSDEFYGYLVDGPKPPKWRPNRLPDYDEEFEVFDMILAKYVDDNYYRAKIMDINDDEYYVFFVDFGSSEFLTRDELAPCYEDYKYTPFLAYRFQIKGIRTAKFMSYQKITTGIQYLNNKIFEKEIDVAIKEILPNDGYLICFQGEMTCLHTELVSRGYAYTN
ncbi:uncharacterized protein LOC108109937 [Drosophila eugracilis]|uniref:uncharacterized protein LOC108109937 n=1 Tax=Drosophila eugracilis TaxID=29029 RepID=UPI0007E7F3BF|nr:uncharacterized protein LOC108109937 [Drosophila eugracilis]